MLACASIIKFPAASLLIQALCVVPHRQTGSDGGNDMSLLFSSRNENMNPFACIVELATELLILFHAQSCPLPGSNTGLLSSESHDQRLWSHAPRPPKDHPRHCPRVGV
ncbi:hypothetical protein B0H63DRAFT_561921, partial [Podospora didyma]